MKRYLLLALFSALFVLTGCKKDDTTTDPGNTQPKEPLVGTWYSEAEDVAPGLLATLKTTRIKATFNSDNTYEVVATDSANTQVTYKGTFTTTSSNNGNVRTIVLNQTLPTTVTSTGIYEVHATTGYLKYEVLQTTPAVTGFTAPVADSGFGSTKYNGIKLGLTWVQNYVPATPSKDPLIATWLSEGLNVAPGLKATLKTKKIDATFNADATYKVIATDSANAAVTYEGTYSTQTNANMSIRTITLNQSKPTTVTSTGIYRVTSKMLTYEVLQTTPAITGFTAPTAAEGFGSTKYNSFKLGATWIQKYVKN